MTPVALVLIVLLIVALALTDRSGGLGRLFLVLEIVALVMAIVWLANQLGWLHL